MLNRISIEFTLFVQTSVLLTFVINSSSPCEYNSTNSVLSCSGDNDVIESLKLNCSEAEVFTLENWSQPYFLEASNFEKCSKLNTLNLINVNLPFWKSPKNVGQMTSPVKITTAITFDNVKGIHNWNWAELAQYFGNSPKVLNIYNSRFVRLPSEMLHFYGQHVTQISIIKSKLTWLDDNSLSCSKCSNFIFINNQIRALRPGVFGINGPENLLLLDLTENQIKSLPDNLFGFITKPYAYWAPAFDLKLIFNPIGDLEKKTFQPIIDARIPKVFIYLKSSQYFICKCDFKWMLEKPFDNSYVYCNLNSNQELLTKYLNENNC